MLDYVVFNNSIRAWLIALALALGIYLVLILLQRFFQWRIAKWAEKSKTPLDDFVVDLVVKTRSFTLLALALFFASKTLRFKGETGTFLQVGIILILLLQAGFWLTATIDYLVKRRVHHRMKTNAAEATTLSAMGTVAKGAMWIVLIVMALDNIPGVQVSTLIAGLGIGGIAIGLAVQNILGDLLASLSIVLDHPFVIGDFIIVGDQMGTVEHIGIKSTRLRSLTGEQLVFSNADLLASRIGNYQRMERRRVAFTFGVTYQTPYAQIVEIPKILREIIDPLEGITFERAHFKSYGDSALIFEVIYWIEKSDYMFFMDQQQYINLEVYKAFQERDIQFAYPTQTIFLEK